MNFPMTVRYFDCDLKNPLVPRTAIVLGEGTQPGTLSLVVFCRPWEDSHTKNMGTFFVRQDVPYIEAVPSECVRSGPNKDGPRNSRFFHDGKTSVGRFCCSKFDPKLPVPKMD